MFIGIRKEEDGSIYIDKDIYLRTQTLTTDKGTITTQLFTEEELSLPPYNYKKTYIPDEYICDLNERDFDDDLNFSIDKYEHRNNEKLKQELREKRKKECFTIINRGQCWYNKLDAGEKAELTKWYNDWLDVTETLKIPIQPDWLK